MDHIKIKDKPAQTFYEKRNLPRPRREYWPADAGELRDLMHIDTETPLLLIGDGQHVRNAVIGERSFDIVRTESCKRVISVDRESRTVRVEAGIRWGDLQEELDTRGLSLERYSLYPATATVGGLLSRRRPLHREMWDHSIRSGCVALSAASPRTGEYNYIAAPRKASGPDLRYLYIGSEGLLGVILDATLVVWSPSDARLFEFDGGIAEAVKVFRTLHDLGIRVTWTHYSDGVLRCAVHAHERVFKAAEREFDAHIQTAWRSSGPTEVAAVRRELEVTHPERRSLATADRSVAVYLSLNDLISGTEALSELSESLEIWDWTRHRATVIARFAKGELPSELPAATAAVALGWHPLVDDETVHWPAWAQKLKKGLDPQRLLSVGP